MSLLLCTILCVFFYSILIIIAHKLCALYELFLFILTWYNSDGKKILQVDSQNVTQSTMMVMATGGAYAYDGTITSIPQTMTFILDYDSFVSGLRDRRNYQVRVRDTSLGISTTVNELSIVDRTGKTVVSDTLNDIFDNDTVTYSYRIGMVGDINNDGLIDNDDVLALQNYLVEFITLSDEDLLVADVDANGYVNVSDVLCLQRKLAELIDEFPNGAFEYLGT